MKSVNSRPSQGMDHAVGRRRSRSFGVSAAVCLIAFCATSIWLRVALGLLMPRVPAYSVELTSDPREGADGASLLQRKGDALMTWTLRPRHPIRGPLTCRVYVSPIDDGGPARPLAVELSRLHTGTFRFRGLVEALLPPGRWRLTFWIGRVWVRPPAPSSRSWGGRVLDALTGGTAGESRTVEATLEVL